MRPVAPWWLRFGMVAVKIVRYCAYHRSRGKSYCYYYIKVPVDRFPHVVNAKRVVLQISPLDMSTLPIEVVGTRHQASSKHVDFMLPSRYRAVIERYFPDGVAGLIRVDILEYLERERQ